ncbi:hypothetical protein [Methylobacterium trifolii]|uniref:Uncharacterized protein n=1 Tax=Methylobacterium trifolii TaxID=1003092 RepID=A0ABQ4TXW1_9HYPH|nr:hypothetical protein [Methylobacterium trifolii]GJE60100.1 hypothetical protein MPOCJGCO_2210 [Methylobacterium trifolii]
MIRYLTLVLLFSSNLLGAAQAARLTMDDKAALWPRAPMQDKIDFTNRMGKAFSALSPDLTAPYFMRCLEETANIGNPGALRLEELVKACVSLNKDSVPE